MLRIGIVGCGEAAQVIHLPTLRELRQKIVVTAICDVSQVVLDAVATCWGISHRFRDYREIVRCPDVDAILIANPHVFHAEVAIAAMQAGKHVFIEKPMCVTLAEADQLLKVEKESGVVAHVGYMRRYAPAFTEAVKLVREMKDIRLARVHDVLGRNALIISQTSEVAKPTDLTAADADALQRRMTDKTREAIGDAPPALQNAYALLLGLSSHDLSAMREILGDPQGVLYASAKGPDGRGISAAFDYGAFVCQFSTGIDLIPRFDASIEVYTPTRVVRVEYDTPYVRNIPTRLSVIEAGQDGMAKSEASFSWRDAFTIEWLAFYDHIANGSRSKTSIADARKDLVLFGNMVKKMRNGAE